MNRTLLLILLLIVSAAGLLALSLNLNNTPAPTPTPVSVAQTTLVMSAPVASTSGLLNSDIRMNTISNTVTAVQIELSYDPNSLGSVDVAAGTFFKNPTELFKKIDRVNGRVSYALGVGLGEKGVSGNGVVAKLSFSKLKATGTTSISFLPKSLVTSTGISQSVLKSATGLTFDLAK